MRLFTPLLSRFISRCPTDMRAEADYRRTLAQFTVLADDEPTNVKLVLVLHDTVCAYECMRNYELLETKTLIRCSEMGIIRHQPARECLATLFDTPVPRSKWANQGQRINFHPAQRLCNRFDIPTDPVPDVVQPQF